MTEDQIRQEIRDHQKDVLDPSDFSTITYYTRLHECTIKSFKGISFNKEN